MLLLLLLLLVLVVDQLVSERVRRQIALHLLHKERLTIVGVNLALEDAVADRAVHQTVWLAGQLAGDQMIEADVKGATLAVLDHHVRVEDAAGGRLEITLQPQPKVASMGVEVELNRWLMVMIMVEMRIIKVFSRPSRSVQPRQHGPMIIDERLIMLNVIVERGERCAYTIIGKGWWRRENR